MYRLKITNLWGSVYWLFHKGLNTVKDIKEWAMRKEIRKWGWDSSGGVTSSGSSNFQGVAVERVNKLLGSDVDINSKFKVLYRSWISDVLGYQEKSNTETVTGWVRNRMTNCWGFISKSSQSLPSPEPTGAVCPLWWMRCETRSEEVRSFLRSKNFVGKGRYDWQEMA